MGGDEEREVFWWLADRHTLHAFRSTYGEDLLSMTISSLCLRVTYSPDLSVPPVVYADGYEEAFATRAEGYTVCRACAYERRYAGSSPEPEFGFVVGSTALLPSGERHKILGVEKPYWSDEPRGDIGDATVRRSAVIIEGIHYKEME